VAGRLDPAFAAPNPRLTAARVGPAAERFARVRRAEQEATLGYRVTTELTAENRWRTPHVRARAIRQRADHARKRARARTGEREADGTGQPPSGRLLGPGVAGRRPGGRPRRRPCPLARP
jgi:hypothetical protein